MEATKKKKYIKGGIIAALYLLFLYWVKSWWGLLALPLLIDYFVTHRIKWDWWKNIKDTGLRSIMSWVDALLFAAVAVYFVNLFFFQNYVIPSSSLEKSLLTGDYLLVSKVNYGPRIPQTPLTLPLTQHTIPLINTKSYIEWPQWEYRRVAGLEPVASGDIVVFNYPSGDTVALNYQNADYYSLCYQVGKELTQQADTARDYETAQSIYNIIYGKGRESVMAQPDIYGKVVARPTDRRENYVKRCVGLPGETLQIKNGTIYINGKVQKQPEMVQFTYLVHFVSNPTSDLMKELGISLEDLSVPASADDPGWRAVPLTYKAKAALEARKDIADEIRPMPEHLGTKLYPLNKNTGWTAENYGPIYIPKRGATIALTTDNLPFFERPIRIYEGNKLEVKQGKIYINDKPANTYTFKMDYYWLMGDNRDNSADSRFWGFVPEDHIVGKPLFVWLSLDPDYGWTEGKIRWNRFFKWVDNIR